MCIHRGKATEKGDCKHVNISTGARPDRTHTRGGGQEDNLELNLELYRQKEADQTNSDQINMVVEHHTGGIRRKMWSMEMFNYPLFSFSFLCNFLLLLIIILPFFPPFPSHPFSWLFFGPAGSSRFIECPLFVYGPPRGAISSFLAFLIASSACRSCSLQITRMVLVVL